ncbi:dephospho-CoA kinase [uncultured Friedmanniella sp.]|uniref:dephospho-CoA kinase n=1 Tax=uncultured Friedmanniella sp. TaxID=335381 RepID=UPI0035C9FF8E
MLRVGLTGGIASGKSAVAAGLGARGAVVIDSDVLARAVVEPGTPGLEAVVQRFGPEVLDANGRLDRPRLGSVVFADPGARRDLERIIHPLVRARAAAIEQQADPDAVVLHVIPLLVETGQQRDFDVVVVVDLDPATQQQRLMARNGLTAEEARSRMSAQASRNDRLAAADLVVDNNGSPDQLTDSVARLWSDLLQRSPAA